MRFNARFRGLLAASLLTAALMGLMISLFSLPVFFLWPVLLGILAAATVCLMDGARLSWLPAAAWMAACLLTVLVLLDTVTNGLAQLLDDVLKAWQQLHARNYTSFLAQEDGSVGLTVVLCMLGVLCGLWSSRYVRHPSGLRFWPLAVILAAAAVLFAPMVPVWWLLLAALTVLLLYAVHFGGGKQYSPAALRTWGRLAAVLLVCVTVLGGWNQDAARPAVVDTAANWAAEQVDTLRYGSNAGLPEGDMTKVGPRQISGDTMLEVTMTQPISYYLRGFVGEAYANSRWSTLDSKTLSEDADTFYWLHQDGFYAQSQLTTAAQAGVSDVLRYDNTVTVQNIGASGKYLYAPYELLADSDVLDAAQIGDRTLLASGLRGQRFYSFHASDNIITQYQRLAAALLEETEQTNAFLNTEAAYNRFVYDHYTDIPDDIRGFLEEKLGGYQEDKQLHGINGGEKVMTGFGHHAVLSHAAEVVEAVKAGKIRHFFLVGGCDGAKPGRNYYTEFVKQTPPDTIVLTLACGKFRFNDLDLGTIAGLPRIMDVGQCNDAYGAIRIALALAEAFGCSVNELPLSMVLSWYEQKAVCILLTLLHLGIHDILLGPTLPAFLSGDVLDILVKNYNIGKISTPEEDLAKLLHA